MTLVRLLAFSALIATTADAAVLPIKPGYWVGVGDSCKDFAFADELEYDGHAFSYPHRTHCRSVIRARAGQTYTVNETCSANGDGSKSAPDTETVRYRVLSPTRFDLRKGPGFPVVMQFRWCGKAVGQSVE